MIRMLRVHLNDEQSIGWEVDDELVDFLDRATAFLTNILISLKHNSLIKPIAVHGETTLPADFVTFVGKLPIQIMGNTAKPYGYLDNRPLIERWKDPNVRKTSNTWHASGAPELEEQTKNQNFNALYWSRLPYVSSMKDTDTIPYSMEFAAQIMDVARMLALNKNEYDIAQDVALAKQIQDAVATVIVGDSQ